MSPRTVSTSSSNAAISTGVATVPDEYEMKIAANSLQNLTQGWLLTLRNTSIEQLQQSKRAVVAITGSRDVGKTFRLNGWLNKNYDSGYGYKTDGICVAIPDASVGFNALFLDIPGFRRVVPVEQAVDRRATDVFVQQAVVEVADVVLHVVETLDIDELERIDALADLISMQGSTDLVIVHNWKLVETQELLDQTIASDIISACGASSELYPLSLERNQSVRYWKSVRGKHGLVNTKHIVYTEDSKSLGLSLKWKNDQLLGHWINTKYAGLANQRVDGFLNDFYGQLTSTVSTLLRRKFMPPAVSITSGKKVPGGRSFLSGWVPGWVMKSVRYVESGMEKFQKFFIPPPKSLSHAGVAFEIKSRTVSRARTEAAINNSSNSTSTSARHSYQYLEWYVDNPPVLNYSIAGFEPAVDTVFHRCGAQHEPSVTVGAPRQRRNFTIIMEVPGVPRSNIHARLSESRLVVEGSKQKTDSEARQQQQTVPCLASSRPAIAASLSHLACPRASWCCSVCVRCLAEGQSCVWDILS